MRLLPKELEDKIPVLYATEEEENPMVYAKLFLQKWTWYIIEIDEDKDLCFGYVVSPFESELGYFRLSELQAIRGTLGYIVELDLYFEPTALDDIRDDT